MLSGPVYIIAGNNVNISSYNNVRGNPFPVSTWSKDGLSVSTGGRFNIDTVGVLLIDTVQLSDDGYYNNTLMNSVGSISSVIQLIVVGRFL